jgi:F-type H+-transporting ATPase subunit delta
MSGVESRYAEALSQLASENGLLAAYGSELGLIAELYKSQPDLRAFLANPAVRPELKKDLVSKVFGGKIDGRLVNFLYLLIDNRRLGLLDRIFSEYRRLADRLGNVLHIEIVSAGPLTDAQAESIKSIYAKEYGAASVEAGLKTDPSLLGGVLVRIGDKVIDGTVKGRLRELAETVIGG